MKKILLVVGLMVIVFLSFMFIPGRQREIASAHFRVTYSASIERVAVDSLLPALEHNYKRIGSELKTEPAPMIHANLYSSRWTYLRATGNWGGSGNIEGIARIYLLQSEEDNGKVAVHEFAHTVVLKLLLDREQQPLNTEMFDKKFAQFPTWLWEGVSVYEARQFVDPRTLPYFQEGKYPTLHELNQRLKGGKIYDCGYTIIEYILSTYGREKLIELIAAYGDVPRVLQVSEDQFSGQWYEFVKRKYSLSTRSQ